jgi:hypothetical protein
MSLKKTAEDLLQIAEAIEKEAAGVTQFVCDKCNHTTTLAKINASRKTAAAEVGNNVTVSDITVNDQVMCPCPDCDGALSYTASEESKAYYFDEKKADDKEEEEAEEGKDEKDAAKKPSQKEIDEEKGETPEEQALEEKGVNLHKEPHTASIDYDKLDQYLRG